MFVLWSLRRIFIVAACGFIYEYLYFSLSLIMLRYRFIVVFICYWNFSVESFHWLLLINWMFFSIYASLFIITLVLSLSDLLIIVWFSFIFVLRFFYNFPFPSPSFLIDLFISLILLISCFVSSTVFSFCFCIHY